MLVCKCCGDVPATCVCIVPEGVREQWVENPRIEINRTGVYLVFVNTAALDEQQQASDARKVFGGSVACFGGYDNAIRLTSENLTACR